MDKCMHIYTHLIYTYICIYNYVYIHICICGFYIYRRATISNQIVKAGAWHPGVQAPRRSAEKGR